jgi:hypothetical protein
MDLVGSLIIVATLAVLCWTFATQASATKHKARTDDAPEEREDPSPKRSPVS